MPAELMRAGGCESNDSPTKKPRQFNANGTTVTHINRRKDGTISSYDFGAFQLNSVHLKEAKKLGLDIIRSEKDNYTFALLLYKRRGIGQWFGYSVKTGTCSYYAKATSK